MHQRKKSFFRSLYIPVAIVACGLSSPGILQASADTQPAGVTTLASQIVKVDSLAASVATAIAPLTKAVQGADWNRVMFGTDTLSTSQSATAQALIPDLQSLTTFSVTTQPDAVALIDRVISQMQALNPAIQASDVVAFLTNMESQSISAMLPLVSKSSVSPTIVTNTLQPVFQANVAASSSAVRAIFSVAGPLTTTTTTGDTQGSGGGTQPPSTQTQSGGTGGSSGTTPSGGSGSDTSPSSPGTSTSSGDTGSLSSGGSSGTGGSTGTTGDTGSGAGSGAGGSGGTSVGGAGGVSVGGTGTLTTGGTGSSAGGAGSVSSGGSGSVDTGGTGGSGSVSVGGSTGGSTSGTSTSGSGSGSTSSTSGESGDSSTGDTGKGNAGAGSTSQPGSTSTKSGNGSGNKGGAHSNGSGGSSTSTKPGSTKSDSGTGQSGSSTTSQQPGHVSLPQASIHTVQQAFTQVLIQKKVDSNATAVHTSSGTTSVQLAVPKSAFSKPEQVVLKAGSVQKISKSVAASLPAGYQASVAVGISYEGPLPKHLVTLTIRNTAIVPGSKVYRVTRNGLVELKSKAVKGKLIVQFRYRQELIIVTPKRKVSTKLVRTTNSVSRGGRRLYRRIHHT